MFHSRTSRRLTEELTGFLTAPAFPVRSSPPDDISWPRISIVTPSFNQAPFLERTLLSIHNQGYPDLEHIIIDGGSTDGSVGILERYSDAISYWHSRPDHGHCDAINIGAERATGRFMTWINSDDILLPGSLECVGRAISENPDADLIYGNQVEIDDRDRVTKRVFTIDFDIGDFLFEANIIVLQQSSFWRTDLFREVGGVHDCPYAMDYDLFYRFFRRGAVFQRLDAFLSGFRVYPESLTGSGEVRRGRNPTLDAIFRDHLGRERTILDRTVLKAFYKARRFITEPRAFAAAVEHRMGGMISGYRTKQS
jgi:glycosyltransferase involved in cell wall biosynthesis